MDRTFRFLMASCFGDKDSLIYTFLVDGVWILQVHLVNVMAHFMCIV